MDDRHARHRRSPADPRRRPPDGFRTASSRRFERLVDEAIGSLPAGVLVHLDGIEVEVEEVPPGDELLLGASRGLPSREHPGAPTPAAGRITLYRRPIEARASDRSDLVRLVREVVVREIADHFGIDGDRPDL